MNISDYKKLQEQLHQQPRGMQFGAPYGSSRVESIERHIDNVYLNVVVDHPDPTYITAGAPPNYPLKTTTGEAPVNAEYNVTKNEIILKKASDYYCAVIRFTIPLDQVPILICPIVPNQGDPDLTPLIIGIEYGNGVAARFPVNLTYLNQGILVPPVQDKILQVITPYYFMYSYQNLINMINIALGTAWVNAGLQALLPNYLSPYFFLDHTTNLISLVVPKHLTYGTPIAPTLFKPTIFMNSALAGFLDAFNVSFNGYNNAQGNDIYFILNIPTYPRPDLAYYPPGVIVPAPTDPAAVVPAQAYYYKYSHYKI